MNKLSRILLVIVIITCLFAGAAAAGIKKLEVKDSNNNNIGMGMHVIINHDLKNNGHSDIHKCKTDEYGQCEMDGVENGESGKYYDTLNQEHDCHVKDVTNIPDFPKVALPIAATIGLVFFFQQRKNED